MSEELPRRMQRFYRKKPSESEVKEKSAQIAVKQVDSFVQQNRRYPNKDEMNRIADNVFDQLKTQIAKEQEEKKGFEEGIDLGPAPPNESLADRRKDRRARRGEKEEDEQTIAASTQGTAQNDQTGQDPPERLPGEDDKIEDEKDEDIEDSGDLEGQLDEDTKNIEKLAEVEELSSLESGLGEDDYDNVDKEMDTGINNCPRCKSKVQELIFCPKCGEAFCNHCAKGIESQKDSVKYICPKCSAEFKKRKSR